MANFEKAHAVVMAHEGGYVHDPNDNGGETYKGIARKKHPWWPGWPMIDMYRMQPKNFPVNADKDDSLQLIVKSFYKSEFWNVLNVDQINNQEIAAEVYDTAVNMGTGTAALFLQMALNVSNGTGRWYRDLKEDGKIGPKTIATVNKHPRPAEILKVLNILQGARYIAIIQAHPLQEKFFRSWLNRVYL